MLVDRYHFPRATLIALLTVDNILFSKDFQASERFAQFYIQVSEMISGKGDIIIQTCHPENPLLQTLIYEGYEAFAKKNLLERKNCMLPPWSSHILIRAHTDRIEDQQALIFLKKLRSILQIHALPDKKLWLFGPNPVTKPQFQNRFSWQLLLQHPSKRDLQNLLTTSLRTVQSLPEARRIKWTVDVDPIEV